jgi:hypothetical protein
MAARPEFDGYDLWRLVSYGGTVVALLAMVANPKKGRELGQLATLLGTASVAHATLAPPRCARCGHRMGEARPPTPGVKWVCSTCGHRVAQS